MAYTDSIRVVNLLIRDFIVRHNNDGHNSPVRELVKNKLAAKFEEPNSINDTRRRTDAWSRWLELDGGLPNGGILGPNWAKARLLCFKYLSDYRIGNLTFTNGSSFVPLANATSIACKLDGPWTITADCFDAFSRLAYRHHAIKHAVKKRFLSYCKQHKYNIRDLNRILWMRFNSRSDCAFQVFGFKLFCIVQFVGGNRYSTVPKNNLKDRSICLEPLCNMLVQRAVGLGIRRCLKDNANVDLDNLADVHRNRISDSDIATIDLTDCSDTISMWLINYLIPRKLLNDLRSSRSDMTLGLDDNYYVINKVSSMGNGFTFDLMSLVLLALARSVDEDATVFGDDIICHNKAADPIMKSLTVAGFTPNMSKSHIRSSYRESCGAHYIDGHGYVTSFDFRWSNDICDLIVTVNKVSILASIYGDPYESLRKQIWEHLPPVLLGCATNRQFVDVGRPPSFILDRYIRYGPLTPVVPNKNILKKVRKACKSLHKDGRISVALSFDKHDSSRCPDQLRSSQWNVFYQYIHNVYLSPIRSRVVLKSSLVARVNEEQVDLVYALLPKG